MRRWARRGGMLAAAMLVLVLAAVLAEHIRGRWSLNRHLKRLEGQSEKLSVAAVEPKHPAADRNGFADLIQLTNQTAPLARRIELPPSLGYVKPGRAIVAWRLNQWPREKQGNSDWNDIGSELDRMPGFLKRTRNALLKPEYDSGFDYQKGFVDFRAGQLATIKDTARVLSAAGLRELNRNAVGEAADHLHALVLLVARQSPEPLVIAQLVRFACAAIAFNATWQGLQAPGWTDPQLAAIQSAWESCHFADDMSRALEVERALTLDYFEQIKRSSATRDFVLRQRDMAQEMMEGLVPPVPTGGFVRDWIYGPLWRAAWADQDELRSLERWERVIARMRFAQTNFLTGLSSKAAAAFPEPEPEHLNKYDRLRFLFSQDSFAISDTLLRRVLFAQTEQQMALAAVAIQRYSLRFGRTPPSLDALVPEFVRQTPVDWMDGKSLRYRLLPESGFLLYSIGEDGKDDGGDASSDAAKKRYRRLWDGRDAVWPSAATDTEAADHIRSPGQ